MIEAIAKVVLEPFKDVEFQEDIHKYTIQGESYPSVSSLIKKYYEPFDEIGISERKAAREGTNAEELRAEWKAIADAACDRGHIAHNFGEFYIFDKTMKPQTGLERAIVKFWTHLPPHIVPVVMELRMYHFLYKYFGTADILLYDTIKEKYIIADYKTNKDLFKNFAGQKMLAPFGKLLDNPFNHYQIQLSFYQMMFEQFGFKVDRRIIVYIEDNEEYTMYDTQDFTHILKNDLENK